METTPVFDCGYRGFVVRLWRASEDAVFDGSSVLLWNAFGVRRYYFMRAFFEASRTAAKLSTKSMLPAMPLPSQAPPSITTHSPVM